ncbi:MAG: hypothetical protein JSV82_00355 [Planctomycetota bacterium]|nr:MAG: hypothetical protein JSV82_00355 [Planctomycetota bacterium]
MSAIANLITATFLTPEQIGPEPQSMLWLLPLVAAIAVTYKTTKLATFTAGMFIKEAALLFVSIVAFITIIILTLYALVWLITL